MATTKKKLTKPKTKGDYYGWRDITNYIEAKYKCKTEDFAGKWKSKNPDEVKYQNFWHWMTEHYEISNGKLTNFYPGDTIADAEENPSPDCPEWVITILKMYRDEFGDEFQVHFYW